MRRSGSSKSRVRVVWDEDNLDFLEANKTPKQKITEPKTPYHAPEAEDECRWGREDGPGNLPEALSSVWPPVVVGNIRLFIAACRLGSPSPDDEETSMADAVHADAIRLALSEVAAASNAQVGHSDGGWSSSDDETEDMDQDSHGFDASGRRFSFEERRRAHYDEFRKAKELLSGTQMSDEDEELFDEDQQSLGSSRDGETSASQM